MFTLTSQFWRLCGGIVTRIDPTFVFNSGLQAKLLCSPKDFVKLIKGIATPAHENIPFKGLREYVQNDVDLAVCFDKQTEKHKFFQFFTELEVADHIHYFYVYQTCIYILEGFTAQNCYNSSKGNLQHTVNILFEYLKRGIRSEMNISELIIRELLRILTENVFYVEIILKLRFFKLMMAINNSFLVCSSIAFFRSVLNLPISETVKADVAECLAETFATFLQRGRFKRAKIHCLEFMKHPDLLKHLQPGEPLFKAATFQLLKSSDDSKIAELAANLFVYIFNKHFNTQCIITGLLRLFSRLPDWETHIGPVLKAFKQISVELWDIQFLLSNLNTSSQYSHHRLFIQLAIRNALSQPFDVDNVVKYIKESISTFLQYPLTLPSVLEVYMTACHSLTGPLIGFLMNEALNATVAAFLTSENFANALVLFQCVTILNNAVQQHTVTAIHKQLLLKCGTNNASALEIMHFAASFSYAEPELGFLDHRDCQQLCKVFYTKEPNWIHNGNYEDILIYHAIMLRLLHFQQYDDKVEMTRLVKNWFLSTTTFTDMEIHVKFAIVTFLLRLFPKLLLSDDEVRQVLNTSATIVDSMSSVYDELDEFSTELYNFMWKLLKQSEAAHPIYQLEPLLN